MLKIQSVEKTGDYYQIILTEGMKCVGVLLGVFDERFDVEFMIPDPKDPNNFLIINEEENSEQFDEYSVKYLSPVLEYVNNLNNEEE